MKILDRYVGKEFLVYLGYTLFTFIILYVVINVFDTINKFIDNQVPILIIIKYYIFMLPFIIKWIMPITVLLAAIFSVGNLSRSNEITAMKSCGLSFPRIMVSQLILAIFLALVVGIFCETVVPITNEKMFNIKKVYIQKLPAEEDTRRSNITYQGEQGRFFTIALYDGLRGVMRDVMIMEFDEKHRPTRRIDASKGQWEDDGWVLYDGFVRIFEDGQEKRIIHFTSMPIYIPEKPEDFLVKEKKAEEMTFWELSNYIDKRRRSGYDVGKDLVELYLKLSVPFANFVCFLIGAPLALRKERGGVAFGVTMALFLGFSLWGFLAIGRAYGQIGVLPPIVAAWFPDILFGGIGLALFMKART